VTEPGAVTTDLHISTAEAASSSAGISIQQTSPSFITVHRIEDHELEMLTNISRPISLAVSTMAIGACLGLLPSALVVVEKVRAGTAIIGSDLLTLCVCVGCGVAGIIIGLYAARGQYRAHQTVSVIRSRPTSPLTR
jgi:hypothetical protein